MRRWKNKRFISQTFLRSLSITRHIFLRICILHRRTKRLWFRKAGFHIRRCKSSDDANKMWQSCMSLKWNVTTHEVHCARGVEWAESSPYLGRLVRNMFPWLQKSWGGGEPDAEQTRRISAPREKAWLWGRTTTEGGSAKGVKQNADDDDDSGLCQSRMMSFTTSQSQV